MNWEDVTPTAISTYNDIVCETEGLPPKLAYSVGLRKALEYFNYAPGHYPGGIPNAPSPLAAMLTTGLVGAGLGYGAGMIGEQFLPDDWERGKLRRTLALTGGLGGILPGAAWMGVNKLVKLPLNSSYLTSGQPEPNKLAHAPTYDFSKLANEFEWNSGATAKPVNVDEFNQVIWGDPRVANRLSSNMQAAASGVVESAATLSGGTRFITPMDMGRVAAGMGTGYASGAVVGKGLGMLFGLPSESQDRLKNVGLFAGAIANLVPKVFGY